MRMLLAGLLVVAALAVAGAGERGDVVRARALHARAEAAAADDPSDPIWVDAHREWRLVRPWQEGFAEARAQALSIEARRLSGLR